MLTSGHRWSHWSRSRASTMMALMVIMTQWTFWWFYNLAEEGTCKDSSAKMGICTSYWPAGFTAGKNDVMTTATECRVHTIKAVLCKPPSPISEVAVSFLYFLFLVPHLPFVPVFMHYSSGSELVLPSSPPPRSVRKNILGTGQCGCMYPIGIGTAFSPSMPQINLMIPIAVHEISAP